MAVADYALSIKQPWAELILSGLKTIEVRSWQTSYRGPLLIHTGQKLAEDFLALFPKVDIGFRGGFVGVVDLISVEPFNQVSWSKTRPQHLVPGAMPRNACGWRLANPRRLIRPQPAKGELGLFPVPHDIRNQLIAAVRG